MALNLGNLARLIKSKFDDDEGLFQKGKFVAPKQVASPNRKIPLVGFSPTTTPQFINNAQKGLQNFGESFPDVTRKMVRMVEKPVQKVSSFLQQPYKPVQLPTAKQGPLVPRAAYNYLGKPMIEGLINFPSNYVGGITKTGLSIGKKEPAKKIIGNAAQIGTSILDASIIPSAGGVAKNVAKNAASHTLKTAVYDGAKSGAKFGGAYGLLSGLKDNKDIDNLNKYIINVLGQTAGGAVGGAAVGGAIGGVSYKAGQIWNAIKAGVKRNNPNLSEQAVVETSKKYIRDEIGRFSKGEVIKKKEYVPIKQGGKVIKVLEMDRTYKTGKEPEWYPIIRKELGMPEKGFTVDDIPIGLNTKPVGGLEALQKASEIKRAANNLHKITQSNATPLKIKGKMSPADQKLAQAMMEPRAILQELGYSPKEISKLSGRQQWTIANDRLTYDQFKNDRFIRDLTLEKSKSSNIKIKPKAEPPTINTRRGGAGDEAAARATVDKKGYDEAFAKWIGRRDVANTTGVEIGTKYKNLPTGVTGEDVIKYIENPKGKASSEVKKYAIDLRKQYDELYTNAQRSGIDMKYVKDYITHIWDRPLEEVQQMYRSMGRKFNFSKERSLPTYEEGIKMGLKPKYNNPAQIVADYSKRLERVKANIDFASELEKMGYIVPKRVSGFVPITAPGFMSSTVKLGDGTIREGLYYAPPEIAKQINQVFSEQQSPAITRIGAKVSGGLQDITLSGGIPGTPANAWTFAQLLKEVTAGRVTGPFKALYHSMVDPNKYFADNSQFIKEQQLNNIPISTSLNMDSLANPTLIKRTFGETIGNVWHKLVNEPTFKRFMPALQTEFYKDVRNAALKKGIAESEAIKVASQATRNFYGITNSADLAKRSSVAKDLGATFLFAPRYRESMVNFWINNLKALKNPLALENRANATFMVGAAATAIIYDQLNRQFNNGRSILENPSGMEDKLLIPVGNGDVIGVPFLSSIATVPRALLREGKMLIKGDISGAARDALQSYSSMAVKPIADVIANEDYFGQPIVEDNMTPGQKFGAQAKYLGKQYFLGHPYLKELIDPSNQNDPAYQRLSRAMEAPLRFYTEKSIQGRYYYGARDKAIEGLSRDEQTAYTAIPAYDSNDPNTTMFKYQTYLAYPKVFQAKQQTELEMAEKTGKAIDPLYLVDYDTAKKYMRYETLPPGSADRKAMINAYPELQALFEVRGKYFDENPIPGGNTSKRPMPSKYVQAQMDAKNWSDPQVRAYLDANRIYQNEQREKLGLPPLDSYSWGSGGSKKVKIAKSGGGSTKSSAFKLSSSKSKIPKVKITTPPKIAAERPQRKKYNFASITEDLPKKVRLTKTKRIGIVKPSTIRLG